MYTPGTIVLLLTVSAAAQSVAANVGAAAANVSTQSNQMVNASSVAMHPDTTSDTMQTQMQHSSIGVNSSMITNQVMPNATKASAATASIDQNVGTSSELSAAVAKLLNDIRMTNADMASAQNTAVPLAQQAQAVVAASPSNSTQAVGVQAIPIANLPMTKRQVPTVTPSPAPGSGPTIIPILKSPGMNGSTIVVPESPSTNMEMPLKSGEGGQLSLAANTLNSASNVTSNLTSVHAVNIPKSTVNSSTASPAQQSLSKAALPMLQSMAFMTNNTSSLTGVPEPRFASNSHSDNVTKDAHAVQKPASNDAGKNRATLVAIFALGGVMLLF